MYNLLINFDHTINNTDLFSFYKAAHILCPSLSASNNESEIVVSLSTNSISNMTFLIRIDVQQSFNVL